GPGDLCAHVILVERRQFDVNAFCHRRSPSDVRSYSTLARTEYGQVNRVPWTKSRFQQQRFRAPKNRTQRLQMAPNRKPRPTATASAVYGLCFSDLSTTSTTLSPTSRTAPIASRPFSPASEIAPSRSDFARCHEAVPLVAKMSAI